MRKVFLAFVVLALISCARVHFRTEEPIKLNINMRIDVYQHVAKDADSIEDEIYGEDDEGANIFFSSGTAYAAESSAEVNAAVERRKKRTDEIGKYFTNGYIGENRQAHLKIKTRALPPSLAKETKMAIRRMIEDENRDREIIYRAVAKKRGAEVSEVRKVFLEEHYKRAPKGAWFELFNKEKGKYVWKRK